MVTGVRQFPFELPTDAARNSLPFLWDAENALLDVLLPQLLSANPIGPVTVYGPSGTGKSLLLHHLQPYWNSQCPTAAGRLLTGRDWAHEVQAAQAADRLPAWRQEQRHWGLFALDDTVGMQRFATAQRELVTLIDDLRSHNIPVIVTARMVPAALPLSAQLISRLNGGLCVPLALPGQPARREFISCLCQRHTWSLNDESLDWLAEHVRGSYFEIHSNLTSRLSQPRGPTSSQDLPAMIAGSKQRRGAAANAQKQALQMLARLVARFFQVSVTDLKGKRRRKTLVRARAIACHVARTQLEMSYYEIGKWLGQRDHSTIMHACRQASELMNEEPDLAAWVSELSVTIKRHDEH